MLGFLRRIARGSTRLLPLEEFRSERLAAEPPRFSAVGSYFGGKYFFEIISSLERIKEQLGPNSPAGIRGN